MKKINLDAPAFGDAAEKIEVTSENPTADASQAESGQESSVENQDGNQATSPANGDVSESVEDEQKVPYSRMKTVIDARRQAEARAEEAEARLTAVMRDQEDSRYNSRSEERAPSYSGDLPDYWVKMYGDDERSKNAYSYELERQRIIREEARREALEAVREERETEGKVLSTNERIIDTRLEDLAMGLGRDLTGKEEDSILDIMDEYTPKDSDGNYAGDLISPEKAWEIYEMKQNQASQSMRRRRENPTALTSSRSDGEPASKEREQKEFNPLDWNAWRKRIPN